MALLACAAIGVEAAGLGKLTVNSSLGQPLNAEIDLVSLQPGELEDLQARVASPESFRDARIEYGPSMRHLRFAVEKRPNGQAYLKVTSQVPINEPFLDVLVEISWPSGRIQREYPILLDPPGYAQGKVTPPSGAAPSPPAQAAAAQPTPPASAPAASSSAPAASAPSTGSAAAGAPSARAELVREPGATQASGDTYGPVQKGETLRKIAEETKHADVSLEQMLVALYRENQAAFAGNNMNRLKAGQILKVPSSEQVAQIARSDANREYRAQVNDWRAYREQLAGGVGSIPARPESTAAASGRVTTAAVTPPPAPTAEPKDTLKISKTDTKAGAGAGKAGSGGGQERINALQEEVIAKDKALKESQSRVADLEKQIRDMQRLLELKGGGPATAAKPGDSKVAVAPAPTPAAPAKTEPAKPGATATPTPTPATPPTAAKPGEAPKPAELKPTDPPKTQVAEAPKTDAAKPADPAKPADTKPGEAAKPAEAPKVADASKPAEPAKPAPPKAPATPATGAKKAPAPEEGLLDNPWMLAAAGGGILALGLGAFMFMRRRRQNQYDAGGPSSAMTSAFPSDLKPGANTSKPASGLVDTGNSSFLTDFDKTGPGTIDTDEVDPVAEAEVYIAYGRDAQAEEILKEAMARDAGRTEIPLKLLEIYHARKSATAFETVARELKAKVGEDSPMWQKAAAMGAQIDPNNPLYGGAAAMASTAAFSAMAPAPQPQKPDVDFDIESTNTNVKAAPAPDFDLDLDAKPTAAQSSSATLDFDIAPSAPAPAAAEAPKEEKPAFDFDLGALDFPSSDKKVTDLEVEPSKPAAGAAPTFDLSDLSLDTPADASGGDAGGNEAVGTKLELAKAYLEIGDKDGAREILQEVAKEGSAAQKEEAQRLIGSL